MQPQQVNQSVFVFVVFLLFKLLFHLFVCPLFFMKQHEQSVNVAGFLCVL